KASEKPLDEILGNAQYLQKTMLQLLKLSDLEFNLTLDNSKHFVQPKDPLSDSLSQIYFLIEQFFFVSEYASPRLIDKTKSIPVVVLSPSVQRSVALKTYLLAKLRERKQKYASKLRIAELFGKHRKVESQRMKLMDHTFAIAVTGPDRLQKLCDLRCLNPQHFQLVILDMQKNVKNMNMLDIYPMNKVLCEWMFGNLMDNIRKGKVKLAMVFS
ncbi:hypothetical protein RFI_09278, partial [Reticulomyxa filosa]